MKYFKFQFFNELLIAMGQVSEGFFYKSDYVFIKPWQENATTKLVSQKLLNSLMLNHQS